MSKSIKIRRDDFRLLKVAVKSGFIKCKFDFNGQVMAGKIDNDSRYRITKDLNDLLQSLRENVKEILFLTDEGVGNLDIHTVTLTGSGEKSGIVISAKLKVVSGNLVNLNTHNLFFSTSHYGFEEGIEDVSNRIADEVYKIIFESKTDEMTLYNEDSFHVDEESED